VVLRVLSGIELVRELKRDADLGRTPAIIWSAVREPDQIKGLATDCEPFTARNKVRPR
jgi:hypothetical protein